MPRQNRDVAERDFRFREARRYHRRGDITLDVYYKNIRDLYKFEPRKKYVEELQDTAESDSESGSDSDESDPEPADSTSVEVESTTRTRRFRAAVTSSDPQIENNTPEPPAPTTSSTQATSKTANLTQLQPPKNCLTL